MVDMIIRLIINMVEIDMTILIVKMVDMDMTLGLIINIVEMDMVKLIAKMVDHTIIKLIIRIVEMNEIIGLIIDMVDVGVIKQIIKDMGSIDASVAIKGIICMVMTTTYIVNTSGEIIRTTLTQGSHNKRLCCVLHFTLQLQQNDGF